MPTFIKRDESITMGTMLHTNQTYRLSQDGHAEIRSRDNRPYYYNAPLKKCSFTDTNAQRNVTLNNISQFA